MSGNTEELRRKIGGAGDLAGVVRAMKALAASSIGQYEKAVESLDHYCRTVELGLAACLRQAGRPQAAFPNRRDGPVGAVIFGSDQGLVGRFNEVLVDFASAKLESLPGKTVKVWPVGERIQALMSDAGLGKDPPLLVPGSVQGITPLIDELLIEVERAREGGEINELYLFHNRPRPGATYEPSFTRLLPLDQEWERKLMATPWPTSATPEVIEGERPALKAFIRGYLFVVMFQACAESLASENASRLAAMQRAEKNIGEMLEDLKSRFHRMRQEAIDEELFDVVSGYEVLARARGGRKASA
jgi:F-type H+-transporting ATPase subunit gamma